MDEMQTLKKIFPQSGYSPCFKQQICQTHRSILVGWLTTEIVTAHNYIIIATLSISCVLISGTYINWQSKW